MNDVIGTLRELVAFNTVSTQPTSGAIDYIRRFLEPHGYRCEVIGDAQFQGLICRNDAALRWSSNAQKYLAFCAHIDTVPFDADLWRSDPLRLEEREGKLYGLGAADMKGPLACMLYALRELSRTPAGIPAALVVTHHEETALDGALELVSSAETLDALRPMQLVIGEPTRLALGYAHKGVFDYTVTVAGRASHSGTPHDGLNAIYGAARVALRIRQLNDVWRAAGGMTEHSNVVNVGTLHAGDVRNRVPDFAELSGDMRIIMGSETSLLTDALAEEFQTLAGEGYLCDLRTDYEAMPFEMPTDEGMVRDVLSIIDADLIRLGYATDAAVFHAAGIDCIILGPGDIGVCHKPDEFIERSQLELGVAMYTRLITARNGRDFAASSNMTTA